MDSIEGISEVATVLLGVLGIIWAALMFLAPFFWYGTNKRAREISEKLDTLIALKRREAP